MHCEQCVTCKTLVFSKSSNAKDLRGMCKMCEDTFNVARDSKKQIVYRDAQKSCFVILNPRFVDRTAVDSSLTLMSHLRHSKRPKHLLPVWAALAYDTGRFEVGEFKVLPVDYPNLKNELELSEKKL